MKFKFNVGDRVRVLDGSKTKNCSYGCKDCFHYKMCSYGQIGKLCADFSDKSEWIHLPCKVGGRVFSIVIIGEEYSVVADRVRALRILAEDIYIDTNWYECVEMGYNVFLTQEEAEKALAKRKEK